MQNTKNKRSSFDIFLQLTRRHLLVFLNNKIRLMYTLLVPVIIFVVYVLFLRGLELTTVENMLLQKNIQADATLNLYIEALVDSWMLSGIAALSTITVALQTNTLFVEDKQNGVNRDFASSPIPRGALIGSYFLYNFLLTLFICVVYLVICFVYLACMGEFLLGFLNILEIFGVLVFTTISATLMTVFICSYIKTEGTMASLVAIFSTAVGFLIGAYMPLGMLPTWVQTLCAFLPGTYACSLLRYSFMSAPLEALMAQVQTAGIDMAIVDELTQSFGFQLNFFGLSVTPLYQAIVSGGFVLIFLVLNLISGKNLTTVLGMGKKKKKK